jgi:Cu-processing system permease protein
VAVTTSVVVGLSLGGAFVGAAAGTLDLARLSVLIAAGILTGLAFLSIAFLISAIAGRRLAAIGVASFVWFVSVIFYDAVMLGVATRVQGMSGARVLFVSVFGNVVDLVRVLTLLAAGTPHILGAAGESWLRALGGPQPTALLSITVLMAWMVLPLLAAVRIDASRDL